MINALHLIWIIPCSAIAGASLLMLFAAVVVAKDTDRMMKRKQR